MNSSSQDVLLFPDNKKVNTTIGIFYEFFIRERTHER